MLNPVATLLVSIAVFWGLEFSYYRKHHAFHYKYQSVNNM
jgi:hypothetical protein